MSGSLWTWILNTVDSNRAKAESVKARIAQDAPGSTIDPQGSSGSPPPSIDDERAKQRRLLGLTPDSEGWRNGWIEPPPTQFSRAGRSDSVEIAWIEHGFDWRFSQGFLEYGEDGIPRWVVHGGQLLTVATFLRWRPLR